MKLLHKKIALVTGASRGIGKAIALQLASEGAFIIVHYANNKKAATEVLTSIKELGTDGVLVQANFDSLDAIDTLIAQVNTSLGQKKIDILINNAGILHRIDIQDITEKQYDELFNINVKAPFFLTQKILPKMSNGGRIINLSSYLSKRPKYEYSAYSMTKAALDNFTISLAIALGARKITVNTIAPGSIATDMNKDRFKDPELKKAVAKKAALQRVGTPNDISNAILFLLSDAGKWITGQYIEVSGGMGLIQEKL